MNYLFLFLAIGADVVATSALKATAGFTTPWSSLVTGLRHTAWFVKAIRPPLGDAIPAP